MCYGSGDPVSLDSSYNLYAVNLTQGSTMIAALNHNILKFTSK